MTSPSPDVLSFIETQFPVAKLTKEALKERRANTGQTLTGMGKWWGRKQLIIVRASVLGMLMPASADPRKDQEIFLKILTMDDDALWKLRCDPSKTWTCNLTKKSSREIEYEHASPAEKSEFFEMVRDKPRWLSGTHLPQEERAAYRERKVDAFHRIFVRMSYEHKLRYCARPEEIEGPSKDAWNEINQHLGTSANSLRELVDELGKRRFGHKPRLADPFCGGGSIPFEAARIGCEAIAGDISPAAGLLTWASMNILGGDQNLREQVSKEITRAFDEMAAEVANMGFESREDGARAHVHFYCNEITDPNSGWKIPLASNWVIDGGTGTYAKLIPHFPSKSFQIKIFHGGNSADLASAKADATWKNGLRSPVDRNGNPVPPESRVPISAESLRGAQGLRLWDESQITPGPSDKFQERLYCILWSVPETRSDGSIRYSREYAEPSEADHLKENLLLENLKERFVAWQQRGFLPSARVVPGNETSRLQRERGWSHWHHLFFPRQLMINGLFLEKIFSNPAFCSESKAAALLTVGRFSDFNSKMSIWNSAAGKACLANTFLNQALNTSANSGSRGSEYCRSLLLTFEDAGTAGGNVEVADARKINYEADLWITDPSYADAVNYGELGEFFLAWYEKLLPDIFPSWSVVSARDEELSGSDHHFRIGMRDCYKRFTENMPDNGMQMVMFTHQDPEIWADLALVLWSAGLRVSAAWVIETELTTGLRTGAYVQGTVLLVLRKRTSTEVGNLAAAWPRIRTAIAHQLESMKSIDEGQKEPNFCDADLHLAAYAAALSVLTNYGKIAGVDAEREIARPRARGEKSVLGELIRKAEQVAADYLVPAGLSGELWRDLKPVERFYLKGIESESGKDKRIGTYQNYARTFGVGDYSDILGEVRDHATRVATPSELNSKCIRNSPIAEVPMGRLFFAIQQISKTGDPSKGEQFLRDEFPDFWDRRKPWISLLEYIESHLDAEMKSGPWLADAASIELLIGRLRSANV
jgi:adenine-specific DNA methylase